MQENSKILFPKMKPGSPVRLNVEEVKDNEKVKNSELEIFQTKINEYLNKLEEELKEELREIGKSLNTITCIVERLGKNESDIKIIKDNLANINSQLLTKEDDCDKKIEKVETEMKKKLEKINNI